MEAVCVSLVISDKTVRMDHSKVNVLTPAEGMEPVLSSPTRCLHQQYQSKDLAGFLDQLDAFVILAGWDSIAE